MFSFQTRYSPLHACRTTRSRSRVPAGPPPGSASVCRHPDRRPYVRRRVTGRRIRPVVEIKSRHEEAPLKAIVPSVRSPLPYRDSRRVDGTCPVRTTVAFRRAGALARSWQCYRGEWRGPGRTVPSAAIAAQSSAELVALAPMRPVFSNAGCDPSTANRIKLERALSTARPMRSRGRFCGVQ